MDDRIHASILLMIRQRRVAQKSNTHTRILQLSSALHQLAILTRDQKLLHRLIRARANARAVRVDITVPIVLRLLAADLAATATAQHPLVACLVAPLIDTHTSVSKFPTSSLSNEQ